MQNYITFNRIIHSGLHPEQEVVVEKKHYINMISVLKVHINIYDASPHMA